MTTLRNHVHIDAPVEEVWNVLADFGGIAAFNPGVVKSRSLGSANSGRGAERQCDLDAKSYIRERIVDWHDGKDLTLEIYEGKGTPPFKDASTTFTVTTSGTGTRVSSILQYRIKGGPLGRLLDRLVVSRKFAPAMVGVLAGLKRHVETGELVTETTSLDSGAVETTA